MNAPGPLTHHVDYRRLAIRRQHIRGELQLSQLPRVAAETAQGWKDADGIGVQLEFEEDAQRRVRVAGSIATTLSLICQRCLRSFQHRMDVAVAGVVVGDDDAAADVPRDVEPVLASGDMLDVYELVADELLLALPAVARCDRVVCSSVYKQSIEEPETIADKKTHNPFAVLKKLKRDD